MATLYVNGEFVPEERAVVPVSDRSYLFGEGLFESLRSYDGALPLLVRHLKRLEWSATVLGLDFPQINFAAVCQELLAKNALRDARFKIVLSRAGDPFKGRSQPNLTIFCEPFDAKDLPESYRLTIDRTHLNGALPLVAIKTTSRLTKLVARELAREAGYDDAVLLNAAGNVTEATTGNLFWLDSDARLKTIIPEQGLLGGVMLGLIREVLAEKKLTCRDDRIAADGFTHAREIFLTNSLIGIKPVVSVDDRVISGGEVGPVTLQIMEFLSAKLKEIL